MLPKQIESSKVEAFSSLLPLFYTSLNLINNPSEFHSRFIKGGITEQIIENLLTRTLGAEKIKWDGQNVQKQMYYGPSWIPDPGFDIEIFDLTCTKIDVKFDSNLASDRVSLNLLDNNNNFSLLLSGKADVSAHVYLKRREYNRVEMHIRKKPACSFELKVLWIDLKLLRGDLINKNNLYSLDKYFENTLQHGQRAISFPVKYLVDNNYARLDTFKYDLASIPISYTL